MAVAFYEKAAAIYDSLDAPNLATVNLTVSGSNTALLMLMQLRWTGDSPTAIGTAWDYGASNQNLTEIESWYDTTTATYFFLYGLVNPVAGSKVFAVGWTGSGTYECVLEVVSFTGVKQTSVATAFTNVAHASNSGVTASISVTSASGNIVVGHGAPDLNTIITGTSDTTLYISSATARSAANYKAGAASATLTFNLQTNHWWATQGVNIVAATLALTATNLKVAVPVIGSAALTQNQVFTATGLQVAVPVLGTATLAQTGAALTATSLQIAAPVIGAVTLTQKQVFTATSLQVAVPVLGSAAFGRSFTSTNLSVSVPVVGTATLAQKHVLTATSLVVSASVASSASLTLLRALTASSLDAPKTVLDTLPTFALVSGPVGVSLAAGSPVIGVPTITQKHALTATSLQVAVPVIGSATFVQTNSALTAISLQVAVPVVGAAALAQTQALTATSLQVAVPVIGSATLAQKHALQSVALVVAAPVVGSASTVFPIALTSTALTSPAPKLDALPAFAKASIAATSLKVASPVFGTPTLTAKAAISTANIAVTPVITTTSSVTSTWSPASLKVGAPVIGVPTLRQTHVLAATSIAVAAPAVNAPSIVKNFVTTSLVVGSPVATAAAISQIHVVSATSLWVVPPIIAVPILAGTSNNAISISIEVGSIGIGQSTLGQTHRITAASAVAGHPLVGSTGLTTNVFTTNLAVGAPWFSQPALVEFISPPYIGIKAHQGAQYDGIKEMVTTNLNADIEMRIPPGVILGRFGDDFGPVQSIPVEPPLKYINGRLSIDIEALKALLGIT